MITEKLTPLPQLLKSLKGSDISWTYDSRNFENGKTARYSAQIHDMNVNLTYVKVTNIFNMQEKEWFTLRIFGGNSDSRLFKSAQEDDRLAKFYACLDDRREQKRIDTEVIDYLREASEQEGGERISFFDRPSTV